MRIYYGWIIVAIGIAVLTLVVGTAMHSFSLFVLPVSREFGLSRAQMNTGLILLNFGMAFASPVLGRILDRRSARSVTAVCALAFGASLVALSLSSKLWLSGFVLAVPLAIGVVGCGTLTSTALVARWFGRQRGRAMAIAAIGISLGPLVIVPAISVMIASRGWRETLLIAGAAIGATLLLLSCLIRDRPGAGEIEPGSNTQPAQATADLPLSRGSLTIAGLIRLPVFWTIACSAAFAFGIQQAILVSLVPLAQDRGFSVTQGATLFSVFGGMAIGGKILLAWLGDRVGRVGLLAGLFALLALTSGALMLAQSYAILLACSALLGLAAGASTPAFLALIADRFGAASFGTASGTASFLTTIISAGCIRYGGEVFDRTGSYRLMFLSFLVLGAVSALLMLATGRLRAPLDRA